MTLVDAVGEAGGVEAGGVEAGAVEAGGVEAGAVEAGAVDLVGAALAELSGLLLGADTLEEVLRRVVDLAVLVVPGCTSASVTLVAGSGPRTAAHSDGTALEVDAVQYTAGDGPCLDAARTLSVNRVDLGEAHQRWPAFAEGARRRGICSFLAAPLAVRGRGLGSLNLYSDAADGFGALDEQVVTMFCGQASVALANAQLYRAAQDLSDQLRDALQGRAVIERAKGALMVSHGISEEQAFAVLRTQSQRRNVKLREVAAEVFPPPAQVID